jgi:carboxypeptidase T
MIPADDTATFLAWADSQELPTVPEVATNYRFQAEVFAEVAAAVRRRPGCVKVELLGHTTAGKPLWAFHAHDPARPPERDLLVFGGIHALEWIGVEVATDVLLDEIDHPTPGVGVTVIPLLNPDGRRKVEADLLAGVNTYHRGNEKNVDLNRDFAVNAEPRAIWRAIAPGYYAHSAVPLSQPESRALDELAAREMYDRAVSLHSFGGFLYWPWTGRFERPPDQDDFEALGTAMQAAQGGHAYTSRQLSRWGFFFRAQGTEIDGLYGNYGTRAFLIELTHSGIRPTHPRDLHTYFRWYNPVDPTKALHRGVAAVEALIRAEPTPGELAHPAGSPRTAD